MADPELNGTYTLTVDETQATSDGGPTLANPEIDTTQWVVTPCGAGCAQVAIPDAPNLPGANGGDLRLVNGRWEMTQETTLMHCGEGPDVTTVTSLDAATLQGTKAINNHCVGVVITSPATLTPA
ncbi:hypothetical protein [Mycolicibacterium stellerae]|uniref:hypothetical protein n=1 Tax=Mycolicibacterium stellerae TaxID=2358193 RepID=UPI0013DE09CF|nr:hypothetical protein [Mycolicibacterium stellerae]